MPQSGKSSFNSIRGSAVSCGCRRQPIDARCSNIGWEITMQPARRLIQLILIVSGMLLLTTATLFGRGVNDINRLFANDRFVAGSPNPNSPLGTNLGLVTDFSNQLPFVDAFKMARTWIPHCVDTGPNQDPGCNHNNAWNTGEADSIEVDENGWVTALPAPEDGPVFTYVGTVLLLGDAGGLRACLKIRQERSVSSWCEQRRYRSRLHYCAYNVHSPC